MIKKPKVTMMSIKNPKLEAPRKIRPNKKDKMTFIIFDRLASGLKLICGPSMSTFSCEYPSDLSKVRTSTGEVRICRDNFPMKSFRFQSVVNSSSY